MAKDKFDILNEDTTSKEQSITKSAALNEKKIEEDFIKPFPMSKFPKSYDDLIKSTGVPRNTYIKIAVREKLERSGALQSDIDAVGTVYKKLSEE